MGNQKIRKTNPRTKEDFEYSIKPFGYLERAKEQLRSNRPQSIFYAALELRCAIEVRAREQLLSLEDIPKRAIKLWHAEKIMDELEKQIDGAKYSMILKISFKMKEIDQKMRPFTYIPIDKNMLVDYGKLGSLLHSQKNSVSLEFIRKKRKWLRRVFKKIDERCKGHMLKPPKWKIKCSKCSQYLKWNDLHNTKDQFIICSCGHKGSLMGKEIKMVVTVRKKSKRTVEFLQAEHIEGEI